MELELDWACVVCDADLHYGPDQWEYRSFVGSKWQKIHAANRQMYLKMHIAYCSHAHVKAW